MFKQAFGVDESLYRYILSNSLQESDILAQLREETAQLPQARMQISPDQGQLMALLVRSIQAKKALEVGVFTGYSSLCVAMALPPNGKLIACDVSEQYTTIARRYWAMANVSDKIELHLAPAIDTLDRLLQDQTETFDFAFIDADKGNYANYYDRAIQLVRPGGLIAIDNVLWSGRVADETDHDKITNTIRAFNAKVAQDDRVWVSLLPIADGLTLALKK
ncbi:class I SAM-dependent methyltransferase [Leptolyngbya sp. FACHB-17]|uniref:O-methyltransferase n=1 Tax=unclassified Leptolyngbya TaxID=2650499 RepID=UPI00168056F7|nr:class I SAM-dependent methyltransferase [Leptolyngbya sp. FACHB-17]MBD2083196.1 class I SAM-dependent methyltransferase [Leptolyngbya sp. FACHB-17]